MAGVFIKHESDATTPRNVDVEGPPSMFGPQDTLENNHLRQLVSDASTQQLEDGVSIGMQLLESLKAPLNSALGADTHAKQWLEAIQQLQDKAKPTRTVVGVVGNTGAGKSSVINAILDEENLIPTNGMRACTASATEISWNHSDDPAQLYRAEVDFIAQEDWNAELTNLFHDLLDGGSQISSDCNNPDTEAGLAYAKIRAVYPHQSKALLVRSNPDHMAQEPAVRDTLGSVKHLAAADAPTLFKALQQYVDSKEKNTEENTRMEYWPLVKVVRMYCKAPALATGAVIVDLPGVQDSNAARAAVARNYLKLCTGIWVTTAIQRAVDDRVASKLMDDSFKRQLKFDGSYSAISFICTKTDDILVSEVSRSLGLEEELGEKWQRVEYLQDEQTKRKQQIARLKDETCAIDTHIEELDAKVDAWEELSAKLGGGELVYRPNFKNPKKRQRRSRSSSPRKRPSLADARSEIESGEDTDASDEEHSQQPNRSEEKEHLPPLTNGEIETELLKLKIQKKDLRKSRKTVNEHVSRTKKEVATLASDAKTLRSEIKSVCVKGRNEYSRTAIKNDFASGIKELDQQAAIVENEANFNPDEDIRNYEAVAQSLPVFCVSARAYQKLSGRLQKDTVQVDGFRSADDTEVPSLQEHTRSLTETGRANNCRHFLNDLDQLLDSMKLWASSDTGIVSSEEEQKADELFVRMQLTSLRKCLHGAVEVCVASFRDTLAKQIYSTFDRAIPKASREAIQTATSWGAYGSDTGLHHQTYKATTRRSGVFRRKDFNVELLDPIFSRLSGPWERIFQRALPSLLNDLARECKRGMSKFHVDATSGVQRPATNPIGLVLLQRQLRAANNFVDAAPADLREEISSQQREANRGFTPVIQQAMQHAYDMCVIEHGLGSYVRMKSAMISHVEEVRHTMFREACDAVRQELEHMCKNSEAAMQTLVSELYRRLKRDYLSVLVQGSSPEPEKNLRASMRKDVAEADLWFAAMPRGSVAALQCASA